jgi:hypothetical protein
MAGRRSEFWRGNTKLDAERFKKELGSVMLQGNALLPLLVRPWMTLTPFASGGWTKSYYRRKVKVVKLIKERFFNLSSWLEPRHSAKAGKAGRRKGHHALPFPKHWSLNRDVMESLGTTRVSPR